MSQYIARRRRQVKCRAYFKLELRWRHTSSRKLKLQALQLPLQTIVYLLPLTYCPQVHTAFAAQR